MADNKKRRSFFGILLAVAMISMGTIAVADVPEDLSDVEIQTDQALTDTAIGSLQTVRTIMKANGQNIWAVEELIVKGYKLKDWLTNDPVDRQQTINVVCYTLVPATVNLTVIPAAQGSKDTAVTAFATMCQFISETYASAPEMNQGVANDQVEIMVNAANDVIDYVQAQENIVSVLSNWIPVVGVNKLQPAVLHLVKIQAAQVNEKAEVYFEKDTSRWDAAKLADSITVLQKVSASMLKLKDASAADYTRLKVLIETPLKRIKDLAFEYTRTPVDSPSRDGAGDRTDASLGEGGRTGDAADASSRDLSGDRGSIVKDGQQR